jgi:serine/threonine protein kinase
MRVGDTAVGWQVPGYRIRGRIGRGGMGVVYRATDLSLDRTVALKVLAEDVASDPDFRRRFVAESKLAASLDHPNVIPIYAAGDADGVLFIAMRFVEGDDLRTVLREEGRLEPGRAVKLIAQVASALDAAHAHGLVHRDVKAANVLVTVDDHAYLTDFGLSKRMAAGADLTRTGMVLGTLDSIAPEQIRHEPIGPWTDVYALGCLSFHLLTGGVPFPLDTEEGKLWAHLSEPPPDAGPPFGLALRCALAKRPQDRFQTAGEFSAALITAAPSATAPRPPRVRTDLLLASAIDPFNVVVLAVLLAIGALIGTFAVMAGLALLVYLVAVARSYRDPATTRRARSRGAP